MVDLISRSQMKLIVDSIGSDENNAPAEYYNMNGIRVNPKSLTPGIYIKRQGNKSYKIVIPE